MSKGGSRRGAGRRPTYGERRERLMVNLDPALSASVRRLAADRGDSVSGVLGAAVAHWLDVINRIAQHDSIDLSPSPASYVLVQQESDDGVEREAFDDGW